MRKLISRYWLYFLLAFCLIIWIYQFSDFDNPDFNNFDRIYSISKEVLTGLFAIISLTIAFEGLSNWNNQLRGENDYDLAFNVLILVNEIKPLINTISEWSIEHSGFMSEETIKVMDKYSDVIFSPITLRYSDRYKINLDQLKRLRLRLIDEKKKIVVIWEKEIGESLQELINFCYFFEIGTDFIINHTLRDGEIEINLEQMDVYERRRNGTLLFKFCKYPIAIKQKSGYEVINYFEPTKIELNLALEKCIKNIKRKIKNPQP